MAITEAMTTDPTHSSSDARADIFIYKSV